MAKFIDIKDKGGKSYYLNVEQIVAVKEYRQRAIIYTMNPHITVITEKSITEIKRMIGE